MSQTTKKNLMNMEEKQLDNIMERILNSNADYTVQITGYTGRVADMIASSNQTIQSRVKSCINMHSLLFIFDTLWPGEDGKNLHIYNKHITNELVKDILSAVNCSGIIGIVVSKGDDAINCADLGYCCIYGEPKIYYEIMTDGRIIRVIKYDSESG